MLITFDHGAFDWRAQPWLVSVGHALVAVPFVVRAILPVFAPRPVGWREAAALLGASPVRAWWEVDVRLLRRPLVVGACFAAPALGEFGATTFLSRTGHETLPGRDRAPPGPRRRHPPGPASRPSRSSSPPSRRSC